MRVCLCVGACLGVCLCVCGCVCWCVCNCVLVRRGYVHVLGWVHMGEVCLSVGASMCVYVCER